MRLDELELLSTTARAAYDQWISSGDAAKEMSLEDMFMLFFRVGWVSRGDRERPVAVPMLLWCPACNTRHIDRGDFATKLHHTHACQGCGMVWRPALVPTVGVEFLPGFRDPEFTFDGATEPTGRR